jgi:SagB-type dehydrogenase family enzyme
MRHATRTTIVLAGCAFLSACCTGQGRAPAEAALAVSATAAAPDVPPTEPAPAADASAPAIPVPPYAAGTSVPLLAPRLGGGLPLMTALERRASSRSFAPGPLDLQLLSDLLWAANGVNRPADGHRTAPTARNRQDLDVYVVLADGAYFYDPAGRALVPAAAGDLRPLAGTQDFVATAPLNLVYVSDLAKIAGDAREDQLTYAGAHAGFVSQNVYLFCASAGLATVVRASFDKAALAAALQLRPEQLAVLSQTVGYPGP